MARESSASREISARGLEDARDILTIGSTRHQVFNPSRIPGVDASRLARRPKIVKVFLENLARNFDPRSTDASLITDLAHGTVGEHSGELPFFPSRVLMQDFTGIPALVDLAAMRKASRSKGVEPSSINPHVPVDLIVDHSVQVDSSGTARSFMVNLEREYERNGERYRFLKWSQRAFHGLRVVPPGNGICHQVNLEYLASVIELKEGDGGRWLYPDTLVGTDSHTTMVNGIGVLGWGVGGIEAEAVLLGEAYCLELPQVLGVRLVGRLSDGVTATDAVLTVTRELRRRGVVGKFLEFTGPGRRTLAAPDRATISNMSPEYGATASLWPIDEETLRYLRQTGRSPEAVLRVEAYSRALGLWGGDGGTEPLFDELVEIDLGKIVPTLSGPRSPEEAVPLTDVSRVVRAVLEGYRSTHPRPRFPASVSSETGQDSRQVEDGYVGIAAITSCTNTSNPLVMVSAGLLARNAVQRGLRPPWWVKTSLAPGSKVVMDYLAKAGLLKDLENLGFNLVGYGCTTCIGNSGPLIPAAAEAVTNRDAFLVSVLSGNRNFEARIHNQIRANFLASPPLVVAYALAGRTDLDLSREPIAADPEGSPVFLRDLWPSNEEVSSVVGSVVEDGMFRRQYATIFQGDDRWNAIEVPASDAYQWESRSTYLREPPYFDALVPKDPRQQPIFEKARVLALFGDGVSTDHISPAGDIPPDTPAGRYLMERGLKPSDFNTYGARRGNHEVMTRGTFANVRLRNLMAGGKEGGWTRHWPSGELVSIYEASQRYAQTATPLVVLAGARYGQGSSRDWAAKGPALLGVRVVIAESYERIHRSNLVGMGILPLEFHSRENASSIGLTGEEVYNFEVSGGRDLTPSAEVMVSASEAGTGRTVRFLTCCRIDSKAEMAYWISGGILPYVLARAMEGPPPLQPVHSPSASPVVSSSGPTIEIIERSSGRVEHIHRHVHHNGAYHSHRHTHGKDAGHIHGFPLHTS